MFKAKLYIVGVIVLITIGGYMGYKLTKRFEPKNESKQDQRVIYEDKTIKVKKINNRGDINIKTPSKNITIKEKAGKHKLSALSLAAESFKVGYCYEVLRWGDFNLNVGFNSHTPYVGVGYSLNPYSEAVIGMGTVPVIGFGFRIK